MSSVIHKVKGQSFVLLPDKAILWKEQSTLLIADLHLGKVTHFRKSGIGLPKNAEQDNLDRFAQLLLDHLVETVYILGDLFHSVHNSEWQRFGEFLSKFPDIQFVLVMGNHDILDQDDYRHSNLTVVGPKLTVGPFIFTHIPLQSVSPNNLFNICGHLHPGVVLRGKGLQSMKLPCFHFADSTLILPAFGAFTGTARISAEKHDQVYAITEEKVLRVN